MEFMQQITERLSEIAQSISAVQSLVSLASESVPEGEDFFDEIGSIADEMMDLVVDAESIAVLDLDEYL